MSTRAVTVVIPCHNAGALLHEALDSLWSQQGDVSIEEVIVVADHSDDVTWRAIEEVSFHSLVRVIENCGPPGPGAARNVGWRAARTDWIAFLDADDILVRNSLSLRFDALDRYPGVKWVAGEFFMWWEKGDKEPQPFFVNRAITSRILGLSKENKDPIFLTKPVDAFIQSALASLCATLVHRDVLENVNGLNESLSWVEDYDFSIRAAMHYDFVFVPQPLFYYRQHGESTTNRSVEWAPKYWHYKAFLRLYGDAAFSNYRKDVRFRLSYFSLEDSLYYRSHREKRKAIKMAFLACWWRPFSFGNWSNFAKALLAR